MRFWAIVGVVLIGVVLLDAFETVVLPRRATRWLPPPGARDVWKVTAWGPAAWSTEYDEVEGV